MFLYRSCWCPAFQVRSPDSVNLEFQSVDKRGWIERKANAEPSHPALSDNGDTSVGGIIAVADLLTQWCEGWKLVGQSQVNLTYKLELSEEGA